jgi:hypothetical protein
MNNGDIRDRQRTLIQIKNGAGSEILNPRVCKARNF